MGSIFSKTSGSMASFLMDYVNTSSNIETSKQTKEIAENTKDLAQGIENNTQVLLDGVEQISSAVMSSIDSLGSTISYEMSLLSAQIGDQIQVSNNIFSKLEDINSTMKSPDGVRAREWFVKGLDLLKKDLLENALEAFKKSNDIIDTNFYTNYQIGLLYLYGLNEDDNVINPSKAENHLKFAARLAKAESKQDKSFLKLTSECFYHASIAAYVQYVEEEEKCSNLDLAVQYIKKSLKFNPNFLDAQYHLAKYFSLQKKEEDMKKTLSSLLETNINYINKIRNDDDFLGFQTMIESMLDTYSKSNIQSEEKVTIICNEINTLLDKLDYLSDEIIDKMCINSISRILWLIFYNSKKERLGLFKYDNSDNYLTASLQYGFLQKDFFERKNPYVNNIKSYPYDWYKIWAYSGHYKKSSKKIDSSFQFNEKITFPGGHQKYGYKTYDNVYPQILDFLQLNNSKKLTLINLILNKKDLPKDYDDFKETIFYFSCKLYLEMSKNYSKTAKSRISKVSDQLFQIKTDLLDNSENSNIIGKLLNDYWDNNFDIEIEFLLQDIYDYFESPNILAKSIKYYEGLIPETKQHYAEDENSKLISDFKLDIQFDSSLKNEIEKNELEPESTTKNNESIKAVIDFAISLDHEIYTNNSDEPWKSLTEKIRSNLDTIKKMSKAKDPQGFYLYGLYYAYDMSVDFDLNEKSSTRMKREASNDVIAIDLITQAMDLDYLPAKEWLDDYYSDV